MLSDEKIQERTVQLLMFLVIDLRPYAPILLKVTKVDTHQMTAVVIVLPETMACVVGIGYAIKADKIAGVAIPIYIAGSLLFTTTYIFNPPSWDFAIYAKNGEPRVISYATEPWVDRYDPYVWKHALFYTNNFSLDAKKYVEFDKEDALVAFTMKFRLDPSLARIHFARLDKNSRDHDETIAIGVMRELITENVKELLASEEFTHTMESLNKTLVHLSKTQQHQTKMEVFRGSAPKSHSKPRPQQRTSRNTSVFTCFRIRKDYRGKRYLHKAIELAKHRASKMHGVFCYPR